MNDHADALPELQLHWTFVTQPQREYLERAALRVQSKGCDSWNSGMGDLLEKVECIYASSSLFRHRHRRGTEVKLVMDCDDQYLWADEALVRDTVAAAYKAERLAISAKNSVEEQKGRGEKRKNTEAKEGNVRKPKKKKKSQKKKRKQEEHEERKEMEMEAPSGAQREAGGRVAASRCMGTRPPPRDLGAHHLGAHHLGAQQPRRAGAGQWPALAS